MHWTHLFVSRDARHELELELPQHAWPCFLQLKNLLSSHHQQCQQISHKPFTASSNLSSSPKINQSSPNIMAIQQRASGVFARAQSLVDRVVSPDTRGQFYSNVNTFAHEQPLLFVCFYSPSFRHSLSIPYFTQSQTPASTKKTP
jgi:hypothetical protein